MNQRIPGKPQLPNEKQILDAHMMAQAERLDKAIREGKQYGDGAPFEIEPVAPGWILCHLIEHPESEGGIIFPEYVAKRFVHYKAVRVGPPAQNALGHDKPRTVTEVGQEFVTQGSAMAHVHRGVSLYFHQQDSVLCCIRPRAVAS